jgi:hypothetical protein
MVKRFRQKPENVAQTIYTLMTNEQTSNLTRQFFADGKPANSSAQSRDKKRMDKTWELCLQLTNQ